MNDPITIIMLVLFLVALGAAGVLYAKLMGAKKQSEISLGEKQAAAAQLAEQTQITENQAAELKTFEQQIADTKTSLALAEEKQKQLMRDNESLSERMGEEIEKQRRQFDELMLEKEESTKKHEQTLREEAAKREAQLKDQFEKLQKQAKESFESIAGQTLEKSNKAFLQLAKEQFKGEQKDAKAQLEKRKDAIKNLVDPIKEKLKAYDETIHVLERDRKQSHGELSATIKKMIEDQRMLKDETQKLVTALKRPEVRGQWGEMHLEKLLEMAGFREGLNYDKQVSTAGGKLRPDTVVHLTSNRDIVIDVKTPLDAYLSAIEAVSKADQDGHLRRHTKNILTQVDSLHKKDYQAQFERTPEFVVMFIPAESFLQPAVQERPTLLEDAFSKGIVIATPSTLIALLKTVAVGWREEALAENARKISEAGKELHKRISTCTGHLEKLGKAVGNTVKHFNQFTSSFESRVVTQARKFEDLEAAEPKKALPDQMDQIDALPREVKVIPSSVTDHVEAGNDQQMKILPENDQIDE
ncbi:DNA recombination protein RmuC [Poriferisphaera corsica]|nr:DNA recombination protein RmuC [Poriferisphaera corsica]